MKKRRDVAAAEVRSPPGHGTSSEEAHGELNNDTQQCPTRPVEPAPAAGSGETQGLGEGWLLAWSAPSHPAG